MSLFFLCFRHLQKSPMSATRTYSPLPPMIPAGDIFRADPCGPREPDPCPHTYGVRVGLCAAFATEPCRPTACIPAAPFRHTLCRFRPRQTTTVWRNLPQHPHSGETYTFSAKERDTETGLSYFGARYYSSDLSIWLSVDPMSDKYPSFSPYVYCANNPVKLVDPNGEEIRGFSINENGSIVIDEKKASKHAIKIYNAMSKTEIGRNQFAKMVSSETKIRLVVTKRELAGAHGFTRGYQVKDNQYKRAKIVISTANLNDRFGNATDEELINAVGVHESVHAIDPEQIAKDILQPGSWETERKPTEMEYTSRTQYNNGNNESFKDAYENPSENLDDYNNKKPAYHLLSD